MNWDAISFDWNHMRAFLATAEEGSLSAAARALGQSQPTLGRQIAALEDALGVVLFERVGRGLSLAPAGQDLLSHVRAMGEAAGRASLVASGRSEAVDGTVSITASDIYSAHLLPDILHGLRALAPGITIDIVAANDIRDLQRREADIAIRHVRPDQPELIARKVFEGQGGLFASRAYLDRHGRPRQLEDLPAHDVVGYQPLDRFLAQMTEFGIPVQAHQIKVMTESGVVAWALACAGYGLCVNVHEVARRFPDMEAVMTNVPQIPVPVWLTCHRELHNSRRIRLVFDYLAEALRSDKWSGKSRSVT